AQAEEAAPTDPVYPSNLSAALYETGDYISCIDAISRAWKRLSTAYQESNRSLQSRLSLRLAKALCHGIRNGSVKSEDLTRHRELIIALSDPSSFQEAQASDLESAWKEWDKLQPELDDRVEAVTTALGQLSRLPIFKAIGHDDIMSIIDNWGSGFAQPIKLNQLTPAQLSNLSFFFGGVGDARHVFGSLIGFHKAYSKLSSSKRNNARVHMTLCDIHPTALARDLVLFMLVQQLIETSDKVSVLEIKATFMYMMMTTINDLEKRLLDSPPTLPEWLHVDSAAVEPVLDVLKYWKAATKVKTTQKLSMLDSLNLSPAYRAMLDARKQQKREEVQRMMGPMSDVELARLYSLGPDRMGEDPCKGNKLTPKQREKLADYLLDELYVNNTASNSDMIFEESWYELAECYVPPPELWGRHEGFQVFRALTDGKVTASDREIPERVARTWLPNITLFDGATHGDHDYPNMRFDAFQAPRQVLTFNEWSGLEEKAPSSVKRYAPVFLHMSHFLDATMKAVKECGSCLKLEILYGELTQELGKMRFGGDHTRPESFPRHFTRIWLSNVPDYTHGPMNMVLYTLPNLQADHNMSAAASNCLLNTGIWHDDTELIHTYTLLHPHDVPRFLGCRLVHTAAIQDVLVMAPLPLPRPLTELASRWELTAWLTKVLLYTMVPGNPGRMEAVRVRLPNSLSAFIALLVHLGRVGFPAHWLSEFLQSVLKDDLTTDIAPYRGKLPIPLSDLQRRVPRRKVCLHPLQAEMENLLATAYRGLPFALALPDGFATSPDEIGLYETQIEPTLMNAMMPMLNNNDATNCLLFYKTNVASADNLVPRIGNIVEGQNPPKAGSMYIITAPVYVDTQAKVVRWSMSKARFGRMRYDQMKKEKWAVVLYRSDTSEAGECTLVGKVRWQPSDIIRDLVSQPTPLSKWKAVKQD
ncbi:hypothetical protein GLOTRDRAFT_40012, partial [Gloeophyllum trabeum ATCC 11539]